MRVNPISYAPSVMVLAVLAAPFTATAQQAGKVYRIGYLSPRPGIETPEELFRQGLRELGYVEGQNLVIEWRFAKGKIAVFPSLAAEIVRLNPDCILAIGIEATRVAKQATATMTAAAIAGRAPYMQAYPALGVGVTNLSLNHLHCCGEQALPLSSVAAWMQHQYPLRLPVDRVGTVDRLVFQQLVAHFGASESAIERWGGALIPAMNYEEQLALYAKSEAHP